MPALTNPRHEYFAQHRAKGKSADEAYTDAGYKPNRHNAAALARQEHISTRVAEILDHAAVRVELTVAAATERLLAVAAKGEETDSPAGWNVARAAIMDACKLNGLVVDKSEVKAEVEVTDARERLAHIVSGHAAAGRFVGGAGKPH